MKIFQPTSLAMVGCNPFEKIGKEWMLVTSGNEERANAMTASWGGMGVMWGKNCVYVVVRESRFTKEFIDREGTFSLSFLAEEHRDMLKYLGSASGRNEDKLAKAGVELEYKDGIPYVGQANEVLLCKVMSATPILPEQFLSADIDEAWYKDKDYHTLYIAQIVEALEKVIVPSTI